MSLNIKVLSDNKSASGLPEEHGFSLYIKLEEKALLFDTGASENLFVNVSAMHIALENLDCLLLSHGHYDHTGGVEELLLRFPDIPIYGHPSLLLKRYSLREDGKLHSIGLSPSLREKMKSLPDQQWISVGESMEVLPGVFAISSIERHADDTLGTQGFYLDKRKDKADKVPDDLSLLVRENGRDHLICGCCHSGLQNTLNHLEKYFSSLNLQSLMGGFHLNHASDEEIRKLGGLIKEWNIRQVICSHCTGDRAYDLWSKELGIPVEQSFAGKTCLL